MSTAHTDNASPVRKRTLNPVAWLQRQDWSARFGFLRTRPVLHRMPVGADGLDAAALPAEAGDLVLQMAEPVILIAHTGFTVVNRINRHAAARLAVHRILPVPAKDCHIAYVSNGGKADGASGVTIVALRKTDLAHLTAEVEKTGHRVSHVEFLDGRARVLSRFRTWRMWRRYAQRWVSVGAVFLIAALIALQIPATYADRLTVELTRVDTAIAAARENNKSVESLRKELVMIETLQAAVDVRMGESRLVDLISLLTQAAPDDVVIQDLRYERGTLMLGGRADIPENWAITLGEQPWFDAVRLTAVLDRADGAGREFKMAISVNWPALETER